MSSIKDTTFSVQIGQRPALEFRELVEFSIDSNVLTLCDNFTFKVADRYGDRMGQVNKGDPVNVYASNPMVGGGASTPLLTGLVTTLDDDNDEKTGTTWTVNGADLGWHIVNNCGPLFLTLNGLTFGKMVDKTFDPSWGFVQPTELDNLRNRRISQGRQGVLAARAPVDSFIPPVCFEAGDNIADKLITYARRAKRLIGVTVDGHFMIYQPDYSTPAVGTLHLHKKGDPSAVLNNIKSSRRHDDIEGIYTDITCVGTVVVPSVLPDRFNPHAGNFKGFYSDPSVLPFKRFLSFSDSDVGVNGPGIQMATARAQWKAQRGQFDSWTYEATVQGHVINNFYWAPDTMVALNDTVRKISGVFYIAARRLVRSIAQGDVTVLTLKKPNLLAA